MCFFQRSSSHLVANSHSYHMYIMYIQHPTKTQGSVTSSIIGFFSGMGDAAKEFGVPEGGCEGVSGFLSRVSLLFIVMIHLKTHARFSSYTAYIQQGRWIGRC